MLINELCRFRPPTRGRLLIWEITNNCNLLCKHCCNSSNNQINKKELSIDIISSIIPEIIKLNIREIYFTGGEPLVRKDFYNILSLFKGLSIDTFFATNGTLFDIEKVKKINNLNIKQVTISLDSHFPSIHNNLRNNKDAFKKTINGIKLCLKCRVPLRISSMIYPGNHNFLFEFVEFLSNMGVTSIAFRFIIPTGRAISNSNFVLNSESRDIVINQMRRIQQIFHHIKIDHSLENNNQFAPVSCVALNQILHITANGDVSPCSWLYKINYKAFTLGNLNERSLSECINAENNFLSFLKQYQNCPIPYANTL